MKKRRDYTLPALGILAGLAATFLTGGAAAPALAGEVAAAGEGAAAAGAAGGALADTAATAGAAGIGGGASGAFGAALGAAPEGASALASSLATPASLTPSITGALSSTAAPGAAAGGAAGGGAAGIYTNPSDLAFQGSKLYNPAEVGQTVPGSFPGSKFGDMAQMNPTGGKGPMDYLKMAQMAKGMMPGGKQQPQMAAPQPHAMGQPQGQQSNEEIYKRYLQMSDPVTYKLLYGGGSGAMPGLGGYL